MGRKNLVALIVFVAVVSCLPFLVGNPYYITVLCFMGMYCLMTIGLSLLMGFAGQISIGHAAFYGIGAYTSGLLTTRWNLSPWLAIVAAVVLGGICAFAIGLPALRLRGHYLAMATLAFGVIVYVFFDSAVDLTGGPSGFGSIPRLKLGNWILSSGTPFYYVVWTCVVAALALALNLVNSRVGRALRSVHSSEVAARAMGVNVSRLKIQVFVLSACLAALAGSFYAHYVTFVSPSSFDFKFSVTLVTMVAIGGMMNLWGALAGTALLHILPEFLRGFDKYYFMIYGAVLISVMIFMPEGFLLGTVNGIRGVIGFVKARVWGGMRG